jgi:hypothetical protein
MPHGNEPPIMELFPIQILVTVFINAILAVFRPQTQFLEAGSFNHKERFSKTRFSRIHVSSILETTEECQDPTLCIIFLFHFKDSGATCKMSEEFSQFFEVIEVNLTIHSGDRLRLESGDVKELSHNQPNPEGNAHEVSNQCPQPEPIDDAVNLKLEPCFAKLIYEVNPTEDRNNAPKNRKNEKEFNHKCCELLLFFTKYETNTNHVGDRTNVGFDFHSGDKICYLFEVVNYFLIFFNNPRSLLILA